MHCSITAMHLSMLAMHHIVATHCSILAMHCSIAAMHLSILAMHCSILAMHHIVATHGSILAMCYSILAMHHIVAMHHSIPAQARCSRPKDVANARIEVGNNTLLNARLRYVCNPGYKRKAGTSSLIQCILRDGSKPDWTQTTLQCIRKPSLSSWDAMGGPGMGGGHPASTGTSMAPEVPPLLETSTLGEGTTPLPTAPTDHAAGQATSPREITHPRGWCQPAKALLLIQCIFPLSPTRFVVRVPSASSSSLALQLKISISLFFSSFRPDPRLFHW
uniref:Sushi domain-containing protein n=1 Tax=Calidris pygmaea TaxID=425635 RepID=A0A8C3K724_9CHAR